MQRHLPTKVESKSAYIEVSIANSDRATTTTAVRP